MRCLLFKGLSVTLPDMTEKIQDSHHHLTYMSRQYCCCGCYCCRPKQQTTDQDTELNMAGNEEDNSSAGSPGASGTATADPDPDTGGIFDFRPPFLEDGNDNDGLPSHLGPVKQLHSATGYNLAIDSTGKVYGTREPYSEEAILEIESDAPGEVRIKGRSSQMYVAMNERGKVYGEVDPESPNTVFLENYADGWNYYVSKVHTDKNWLLGIKKSGKPKKGDKTRHGQKAVKFVPRPAKPRNQ